VLVDSLNNYFVLSQPGDRTVSQEDQALLRDLITIFLLCFVLGALFAHTGVPSHLAYMVAGTVLGPSGYNIVTVSELMHISMCCSTGKVGELIRNCCPQYVAFVNCC